MGVEVHAREGASGGGEKSEGSEGGRRLSVGPSKLGVGAVDGRGGRPGTAGVEPLGGGKGIVRGEFEGETELSCGGLEGGGKLVLALAEEAGAERVDGFGFAATRGLGGQDRVSEEARLPGGEAKADTTERGQCEVEGWRKGGVGGG